MGNNKIATRCGCCGTTLAEQHVGKEACYCPNCCNFVVPLADGETPLLEKHAFAREHPPRGLSTRTTESGEVEIRENVSWRWLWGIPVTLALLIICIEAEARLSCTSELIAALIASLAISISVIFVFIVVPFKLTARRFTLGSDTLVIDSLWLGCLRVKRRRIARRENTTVQTHARRKAKGRLMFSWIVLKTGEEQQLVWRGRNEGRAEFILAVLDAHLGTAEAGRPYLCARCGAAIPGENIDMAADRLTCPTCKAKETPAQADYYRMNTYQAQAKFRPDGVEETGEGFIYRENRWWNGEAKHALSIIIFVWVLVSSLGQVMETMLKAKQYAHVREPLAMGAVIALAVLAVVSIIYFAWRMAWGRFVIHRITLENGRGIYFFGVGEHGRTVEFPYCRDTTFVIGMTNKQPVPRPDSIVVLPEAFAEQQRTPPAVIFRRLPPAFYAWAAGRLTIAASKIDPPLHAT